MKNQIVSTEVQESKYGKDSKKIFKNVAERLSEGEKDRDVFFYRFEKLLNSGKCIPGGRIIASLGQDKKDSRLSAINCIVSGTISDNMESILESLSKAGMTLKAGCGIGYDFSTIRPKNSIVNGNNSKTNGPVGFMDVFDSMCKNISCNGKRRGAQIGCMHVSHPDILDFITCKREKGKYTQFNLSVLVDDEFMEAVKNDEYWTLYFPVEIKHRGDYSDKNMFFKPWATVNNLSDYRYRSKDGIVFIECVEYKSLKAREIWSAIMESSYNFSEPGFLNLSQIKRNNPIGFAENIRATNPCGEQPLPPNGACLLGSINLAKYVVEPFYEGRSYFDSIAFERDLKTFCRMLDNVVELSNLPIEEQKSEISEKRRHGMGFMGLGSAITMMKMKYGSVESIEFAEKIALTIAKVGLKQNVAIAKEKGPNIFFSNSYNAFFDLRTNKEKMQVEPENENHNIKKFIESEKTQFLLKECFKNEDERNEFINDAYKYGLRWTHHSSIAPTGTTALTFGNNVSNGIEPSFSHIYKRNVIVDGKETKRQYDVFSYELIRYMCYKTGIDYDNYDGDVDSVYERFEDQIRNKNLISGPIDIMEHLPDYFLNASDIDPVNHIEMQAAVQKYMDGSISKTINVPTDISMEDFEGLYMLGVDRGCVGLTTFRYNPEHFQPVLVKEEEQNNTKIKITLKNGEVLHVDGNQKLIVDNDVVVASNLL